MQFGKLTKTCQSMKKQKCVQTMHLASGRITSVVLGGLFYTEMLYVVTCGNMISILISI